MAHDITRHLRCTSNLLGNDHRRIAVQGKRAAREALRHRLGLTGWGDKPLVGVVTRLTEQKGAPP